VLSEILKRKGVPHQILNAKNHEKEASIISEAGRAKAITIATNIAGRGVDIILGGAPPPNPKFILGKDKLTESQYKKALAKWQKDHDEVVAAGGLHVIGTERHESRRIDNQLRGRSGRQGDPGSTRFYLALDDDIMRIFGGDQVAKIMNFLKIPEDEPIEHSMVSRAIEQAQIKVEGFNFDARKHVVEYDDVMNKQREIIYGLRRRIHTGEITDSEILTTLSSQIDTVIDMYAPRGVVESEVLPITTALVEIVPIDDSSQKALAAQVKKLGVADDIKSLASQVISDAFTQRKSQVGETVWKDIIRFAYLSSIDNLWIDHLDSIDDLRSGIGLRGYGQRDPLVEYKSEAFSMFERLVVQIESEFGKRLFRIQVGGPAPNFPVHQAVEIKPEISAVALAQASASKATAPTSATDPFLSAISTLRKTANINPHKDIGRNDPCWCGSGKKYKKCHYPN
jgi:preprotein translocase subunit SecA